MDTSDSAAKSTVGFTQISDGVISMCHLLETSTMSPSDKDSWNVAWSHWANPGACQHLWGMLRDGGQTTGPLLTGLSPDLPQPLGS